MVHYILHNLKPKVFISYNINPAINLATEEYLLNSIKNNEIYLFLWQNDNTVVIGRNQNPWKECDYNKLARDGGTLIRRLSGGGAVYHDLGNLNYTFISEKNDNTIEDNISVILNALDYFGINAKFSGKNDILVSGIKISGNAYYEEKFMLCHHGTLLVDANIEKLSNYLKVSKLKLESKGIDSVKSRVINLKEINSSITVKSVKDQLINSFFTKNGDGQIEIIDTAFINNEEKFINKYQSWDWNFGSSPKFDIYLENRFRWGGLELNLSIEDGIIKNVSVFTDSLNTELSNIVKQIMINKPFKSEILSLISKEEPSCIELIDIADWFSKQSI